MTRHGLLLIGILALGGCVTAAPPPSRPTEEAALRVTINASPDFVRQTLLMRAASRGAVARTPNARTVVLERPIAETTPALAAVCGPHKPGRRVSVVITTEGSASRTALTERRFLIDGDGTRCAVLLTPDDVAAGNRSLAELKAQVETQMAGR
ncbi:hypothetical protein [Phreatobacter sp.]|uniref:hypothetical protein n=1 Tax=Phreatobacter sp. TaxID=1966341 RepID=UPI0025E06176|nr:hypothetical protein [Phreatobacter sp.]